MELNVTLKEDQKPSPSEEIGTPDLVNTLQYSPDPAKRLVASQELLALPPSVKVLCQEDLLCSFLTFIEAEAGEKNYPRATCLCVEYLDKCFKGDLTIYPDEAIEERPESFSDVVKAVSLSTFMSTEEHADALEAIWSECADAILKCGHCNAALNTFLCLMLVTRLVSECQTLGCEIPLGVERCLRVYFQLAMGTIPSQLALAWAMANNP